MTKEKITLYKYVSMNNLKEIVEKNRLKLSDGRWLNDPFDMKVINSKTQEHERVTGVQVLCLTNSFKNKLMWAHYADSHRGVCLTIEIPKRRVRSICYTSDRVTDKSDIDEIIKRSKRKSKQNAYDSYDDFSKNEKFAFIKDRKWVYENEYRIVFPDKSQEIIKEDNNFYMSVKITNLYLGVNFNKNTQQFNEIQTLCQQKQISIKQMKLDEKHYALKVNI